MTKPLQRRLGYNHRVLLMLAMGAPIPAHAASQSATLCPVAPSAGPKLYVLVTGVRRVAGNVTFTLYGADRSRFLSHHGSIAIQRVTLAGLTAQACFALSVPGTYAVAAYHDENDNHRLDRTLLGLPAEGYGFSNNVTPLLGLPSFSAVSLRAGAADTRISIKLIY